MERINFVPDNNYGVSIYNTHLSAGNIGLENNNPGNLRFYSAINWQGQTGERYGFVVFSSLIYGYRALMKNLQAYIKSGTNTIEKIIYKWAPPGDGTNNPVSYTKHVSERTGINKDTVINSGDIETLAKIAAAISISEIGEKNDAAIIQAAQMLSTGAGSGASGAMFEPKQDHALRNNLLIVGAILGGVLIYKKWHKKTTTQKRRRKHI